MRKVSHILNAALNGSAKQSSTDLAIVLRVLCCDGVERRGRVRDGRRGAKSKPTRPPTHRLPAPFSSLRTPRAVVLNAPVLSPLLLSALPQRPVDPGLSLRGSLLYSASASACGSLCSAGALLPALPQQASRQRLAGAASSSALDSALFCV